MKNQNQVADPAILEALATARSVVRQRWPEFANIDPQVTQRTNQSLHPADAGRLGVSRAAYHTEDQEYIFTFAREVRTPEGHTIPRVARITVDSQQHVVKAVVSK